MKQYSYLLIDLGCIIIPLLFSFYKKYPFFKDWKFFIPANLIVSLLFIIWDAIFVDMGVWGFNEIYLTGINIYNLPIEEILFFICIPYACTFLFFAIKHLINKNPFNNFHLKISISLFLMFFFIASFNYHRLYTFSTFILSAIFLAFCIHKKYNLSYIYLSYIFIIPFFLISNGILTGSFIEDQIVWYNNEENLNFRIFTVPIEDFNYAFLLIALNIVVYEYLKERNHIKSFSNFKHK